jgi:hypothetical protein
MYRRTGIPHPTNASRLPMRQPQRIGLIGADAPASAAPHELMGLAKPGQARPKNETCIESRTLSPLFQVRREKALVLSGEEKPTRELVRSTAENRTSGGVGG